MRLSVKLKSVSREWKCRHLSHNTRKSALLQDKLFYSNYLRVLDNRFVVLKIAAGVLLTEIILVQLKFEFDKTKGGTLITHCEEVDRCKKAYYTGLTENIQAPF